MHNLRPGDAPSLVPNRTYNNGATLVLTMQLPYLKEFLLCCCRYYGSVYFIGKPADINDRYGTYKQFRDDCSTLSVVLTASHTVCRGNKSYNTNSPSTSLHCHQKLLRAHTYVCQIY